MANKKIISGRRAFLVGSGALLGMGAVTVAGKLRYLQEPAQLSNAVEAKSVAAEIPLRELAAAKGLIYGVASDYSDLSSNPEHANLVAQESAMLVPGLELKWRALRPSPDTFDFTKADWMAEFARRHNLLFRGHTLVWGNKKTLPDWLEGTLNPQNAEQVLVKHIETVAGRYAGRMHSWDVVNEAVVPQGKGPGPNGLRKTIWLETLGEDYIDIAFRAAAEADPKALLVYNDFSLEYDTPEQESKRTNVLKLLERLKSKGTPVQALGIQSHIGGGDDTRLNPNKLRNFMSEVAGLGLKILLTELDASDQKLPNDPATRDRLVAKRYEDYLSVALAEPAVIAVVSWGLSDRYSWLQRRKRRSDGAPQRPLPYDGELRPKQARNAIALAFEGAPKRDGGTSPLGETALPGETALKDIEGHWAQAFIQALATQNIISGFPDRTFRPDASVTRAEFAAIVNKAFTPKQRNNKPVAFRDVPESFWGYDAIQTATKGQFLRGYPGRVFQPNQQIPRVQVLVSLASGLKLSGGGTNALSVYQDAAQIPGYATDKVAAATQQKVVVNYPTVGLLNPNRNATRGEVAAFVYQAMVNAGKAEPISSPYLVASPT